MNNIFETAKIKDLLPKIKMFVKEHLYELETPENLNGLFSKIEPHLLEKRELVKKEGLFGLHLSEEEGDERTEKREKVNQSIPDCYRLLNF